MICGIFAALGAGFAAIASATNPESVGMEPWLQFEWQFRVLNASDSKMNYTASFGTTESTAMAVSSAWSSVANFSEETAKHWQSEWPNSALGGWTTLITWLYMDTFPTSELVEVEVQILHPRWSTQPVFKTTTLDSLLGAFTSGAIEHNQRMLQLMIGVAPSTSGGDAPIQTGYRFNHDAYFVAVNQLPPLRYSPKQFPIADRFELDSDEFLAWDEGILALMHAGSNALQLTPTPPVHDLAKKRGLPMATFAEYAPPGGAHDYFMNGTDADVRATLLQAMNKTLFPYVAAGYKPGELQAFAIMDEPGYYFPSTWAGDYQKISRATERFISYLQYNGVTLKELGVSSWSDVSPMGRGTAFSKNSLGARTLYYWTSRFFSWDCNRYFNEVASVVSEVLGTPPKPTCTLGSTKDWSERCTYSYVNWNNFQGRLTTPGPWARNPDRTSIDTAFAAPDWLESASAPLRGPDTYAPSVGAISPHTEDWFQDWQSYQWSYMSARMRAAADLGNSRFGGYIVGRSSGGGIPLVMRGAAMLAQRPGYLKYYTFGPEYMFPGNSFSQGVAYRWPAMIRVSEMAGFAEEPLLDGTPREAAVKVVISRSSVMFDEWGESQPETIRGITTWDELEFTTGWTLEQYGMYYASALTAGMPVDVMDEDSVTLKNLENATMVVVTGPEIPIETQKVLQSFAEGGGMVYVPSGTGVHGRYGVVANDSLTLLDRLGIEEESSRERIAFVESSALNRTANVSMGCLNGTALQTNLTALGPIGLLKSVPSNATILGHFFNASTLTGLPAAILNRVGKGAAVWTTSLFGVSSMSYFYSQMEVHTPSTLSSLLRGLAMNHTNTSIDSQWRLSPVSSSCSNPLPLNTSSFLPGFEARLIDAPHQSALFMLNWTSLGFAAVEAYYGSNASALCMDTPTFNLTVATPSYVTPKCVKSVTSLDSPDPIPFSVSTAAPNGKTTLVSFALPKNDNASLVLLNYC